MAYNFATVGYHACMKAPETIDTETLRTKTLEIIDNFDPHSWYDAPLVTTLNGQQQRGSDDQAVETVDAFGKTNGKQILAGSSIIDELIAHAQKFKVGSVDLRAPVRSIEDIFFGGKLSPSIVAAQALDFHKQDGITEIEESVQAILVERQLNDALLADEQAGKVVINRSPAFVGCVSNFTNFLDLCRKIIRNVELGVPVIVLSRSNTTQHMYRYVVQLLDLMKEHGVDQGLCTYCSCSIDEQRRLMAACPESAMYFTGSREVASKIKEVLPRLMASTGGPNTMVVGPDHFTPEVAEAARMSNLIEHKGQCTALRHLVIPKAGEAELQAMYKTAPKASSFAECLRGKEFGAMLHDIATPLASGYKALDVDGAVSGQVAVRTNLKPPAEIVEMWREAYLDLTAPACLDEAFMTELAAWLNREQPISLAMNCDMAMARELFENTSLVVYTIGSVGDKKPALTAQARPQDGECFGEFPARRDLDSVTAFPVIIPSSTPGYNTSYASTFLQAHGKEPLEKWGLPASMQNCKALVRRCKCAEQKGYCRVLLEYLLDAATGPRPGVGARTALFGLQRPPLKGGLTCLRLEVVSRQKNNPQQDVLFDDAVRYILPFLVTNAKEQLVISLDPFLTFPAFPMLQQAGLKIIRESKEAYDANAKDFWNVVRLPHGSAQDAQIQYPLPAQFISKVFPMGHIKSTLPNHTAFVEALSASPKWLRVTGPESKL